MKWIKDPKIRLKGAWLLLILSILGGVYSTIWLATKPYERVLMGISWGAIVVSALDVILTADVRINE